MALLLESKNRSSSDCMQSFPAQGSSFESGSIARFGGFNRVFSGTRADLWRLALDTAHSSRPCVTDGSSGVSLSYRDFAGHAARIALRMALLEAVSHDTTVAVSMPRGAAMVASMWASHLSGCVYTPINPSLPAKSKRYILENTRARFFLCSPSTLPEAGALPDGVRVIIIHPTTLRSALHEPFAPQRDNSHPSPLCVPFLSDEEMEEKSLLDLQLHLDRLLDHRVTQPDDVAYYIHTSGSTGTPKCVVHVHSSLDWHSHVTLLGSGLTRADDVCLQVADCSFDLHIRDVFCFISTGGHVVTIPSVALTDMEVLSECFERHRITWVECVPLIFSACIDYISTSNSWHRLLHLRVWSCIGAPFQIEPARAAAQFLPSLQFYNSYAPTECCLVTTMHMLTEAELTSDDKLYNVPVGKPVPGWQCFIYDDETDTVVDPLGGDELAAGVTRSASGICYVCGPGVMKCYLNRVDLSDAAFLTKHDTLPVPLFRVGDVCHYNTGGALVFEGRRDNQIKIQGQRMEPGEVEAVIQSFDGVSSSVVRLIKPAPNFPEHDFLCAYVNLKPAMYSSAELSLPHGELSLLPAALESSLMSLCSASLPRFMVPKVFLSCAVWPRTLSGKINRLELAPPPDALLSELVQRRRQTRLLLARDDGDVSNSELPSDEERSVMRGKVRFAVAACMRLTEITVDGIDADQPLLEVGMNSMQLTLFVSTIRSQVTFACSMGNLLLLPVISINSITDMLCATARSTLQRAPPAQSFDHTVFRRQAYRNEPLHSSLNGGALEAGAGVDTRLSSVISAAALSFLHIMFFLLRLFVLDLLLPLFLYVAFSILRDNTEYNALTASAIYIVVAAAVLAVCFLVVFALLLRSVFRVSSIVDGADASGSVLYERSKFLPLRSLSALRFWMSERISSPVLWFISFLQGTELYNILLRILGAKIGRGCVILCSIDIPSLVSVGDNCFIENGARLRCSQVVLLARGGTSTSVLRVGRIQLGEGSYVACQATITQGVCLPAYSQVECDAYVTEANCHLVPVVPAISLPHGSNTQRVLQVCVVLGFWALLLALSILLIAPWVNAATSIQASAAIAPQGTASSSSPLTVDAQPAGVTVWYYVILFEIAIHPIAVAALVAFHLCIGAPPHVATVRSAPTAPHDSSSVVDMSRSQGLPIGSWAFFLHAVLRRGVIRMFGFPLYTLQSSFIPAAILRACGAKVGKRTIIFNYDYSVELQAPLQQLTIGDDCIVTTFVQLGNSRVHDGKWVSHDVTIGSGCLLGNNSVVDTCGLPIADNTWVSALSHVTSSSVTPDPSRPHNALGRILCGSPTAAPLPVSPSSLLSATSSPPMHPICIGVVACIWAFLLAPALCPCSIEVLVVFFLVINTNWYFSSMLLLIICCEAAAFMLSTLWLLAFECLSSRIVIDGAQYPMFSAKWWVFHWCDMLRSRYISLWPQFFCDSPVFAWFMRKLLSADVGEDVTICEPHVSEPGLQRIGGGSVVAWNSWLQPHTYNAHTLILGSISVGSGCFIDSHSALLPESAMCDASCLKPVSLLMKGDRVGVNQSFGGVPARAVETDTAASSLNHPQPLSAFRA